jgi:hypothetical protein
MGSGSTAQGGAHTRAPIRDRVSGTHKCQREPRVVSCPSAPHESRGRLGPSRPRACTERVLRPGRRTPNSDRVADQSPRAMPPRAPSENAALQGTETIVVVVRGAPRQAGQLDYPCDVLRAATKALPDLRDIHAGFDETHDPALDGAESGALHDGGPSQETPTLLVMSAARLETAPIGNSPGPNRARSDRRPVTRHGPATWRSGASHRDWIRVRASAATRFCLSSSAPPSSRP